MLKQIRTFLSPPEFPDNEDKTRKARYANAITLTFLGIAVFYETGYRALVGYRDVSAVDLIIIGLIALCGLGLLALRKGYVYFTSILLVVLIWSATNAIAATGYGAQDASFITNLTVVLMAGLLLGWQASLIVTILSILSGFGLAYAQQNGFLQLESYPITFFARDIAFVFVLNVVIIYLLINGLENALKRSRGSLEKLEMANVDLTEAQSELQNRTAELTVTNQQLADRTEKLRAIAEITSTAASITSFETLVASIATIISRQLKYYHVGVFLLDEQKQYAILRSASSEIGLSLLRREYRLVLGQGAMVSRVCQTGQTQIARRADSGQRQLIEVEFPDTRSELGLPLKSGNQLIGALDLHSKDANVFSEDDMYTLSILADQIGIVIQNSLIHEQSQRALREANISFQHASERQWKSYAESAQNRGYRYDGIKPEPIQESSRSIAEGNALSMPVELRGQTLGQLRLRPADSSRKWTDDELAIIEATAQRAALALEGARLLDEAQKRAARETFLSEIASKLSASFQLDSILRDTVEELGQTLHGATVSFQLINPSVPMTVEDAGTEKTRARRGKSDANAKEN